jgi:hypothetical protein
MNRFKLSTRVRHFCRDFNTENRWIFPELFPSDILQSLDCDIFDVLYDEFVRAKWMWTRRPASLLGESCFGYLIAILTNLLSC